MKIKVKINEIPKWIQSRTVPGWRGAHYGNRFCRQLRLSAAVAFTIWTNCGARHLEPWNLWDLSDSAKDYTHICHIYVTYMMKWMCIFVCVCVLSVQNFCWPECLRLNLLTICRKCPSNHIGLRTCQRPAQARHNLKSVLWMVTGEAFHRSDSCLCLLTNTDHSRVKGNARLELQARTVTLR